MNALHFAKYILSAFVLLSAIITNAQENQNSVISGFESGNYSVYKLSEKKKFEKIGKDWPVQITKESNAVSQVLVKRAGILDEIFEPDVAGYPAYFGYKTFRLSFIDDYAVYYEWNGKQQATTKYVLVKPGGTFNSDFESINTLVANYAKSIFANQTDARADVKEQKMESEEAERKANSLETKAVTKIEIEMESVPAKVAHFSEAIRYGVIATLKDGTKLKTPNLGGKLPWSDFKLEHKGCSNTITEVRVDEDATSLSEDAILLKVTSIYHPSLVTSKSINTTNDIRIQVNANGFWGSERQKHMAILQGVDGQHAGKGDDLTIKVQTVSHKKTGQKINKIEVYNNTSNKTIARYKLTPDTELIINAKGGQGMNGFEGRKSENKGGNGGNGANGGNVIIIKDPSVTAFNITVNNQGGRGGNGGPPAYSTGIKGDAGHSGSDGQKITKIESIKLNF